MKFANQVIITEEKGGGESSRQIRNDDWRAIEKARRQRKKKKQKIEGKKGILYGEIIVTRKKLPEQDSGERKRPRRAGSYCGCKVRDGKRREKPKKLATLVSGEKQERQVKREGKKTNKLQ